MPRLYLSPTHRPGIIHISGHHMGHFNCAIWSLKTYLQAWTLKENWKKMCDFVLSIGVWRWHGTSNLWNNFKTILIFFEVAGSAK